MNAFAYHRPADLAQAAALLAASEARALAGGMTLLPTIKNRLAAPEALVDLSGLSGLKGINRERGVLSIGALARHADVARSERVQARAARAGGARGLDRRPRRAPSRHARRLLANNDPAPIIPPPCWRSAPPSSPTGARSRPTISSAACSRPRSPTDEIITSVRFPVPPPRGLRQAALPASRYAIDRRLRRADADAGVRVAMTGAGQGVVRIARVRAGADGGHFAPGDRWRACAWPPAGFSSDIHAEAAYRAHLASVMAARAVAQALI